MLFGKVLIDRRNVQPGLHAARRDHGVPVHHSRRFPASLGNFVLPLMLGAKDVAFPRLNLASFYLWVHRRGRWRSCSMIIGAVDTGWTFYTPYSHHHRRHASALMTMAVFILGFSSIFTGINFIATVHKLRAPGMGWFDMPLFVWGIYSTAIIQVLATPVLGITLVLLLLERVFNIGIFDPKIGGDPVLFQHFFWFYSHPAVYIMILPGMAIISELIPTFSRKTMFGYRAMAYSSVSLALLELHRVGPSHVRRRPIAAGHRGLLGADVPGRDSVRRQDVQLAGDHVQGQHLA